MISALEAFSPTARQLLRKASPDLVHGLPHETTAAAILDGQDRYQWLATVRYQSCGACYIAKCDGFTASSTSCETFAALAAAKKRFTKYCGMMPRWIG